MATFRGKLLKLSTINENKLIHGDAISGEVDIGLLDLNDTTETTYTGKAGTIVSINDDEDGFIFKTLPEQEIQEKVFGIFKYTDYLPDLSQPYYSITGNKAGGGNNGIWIRFGDNIDTNMPVGGPANCAFNGVDKPTLTLNNKLSYNEAGAQFIIDKSFNTRIKISWYGLVRPFDDTESNLDGKILNINFGVGFNNNQPDDDPTFGPGGSWCSTNINLKGDAGKLIRYQTQFYGSHVFINEGVGDPAADTTIQFYSSMSDCGNDPAVLYNYRISQLYIIFEEL
jgi:hypothetical protein